MTRIAFFLNFPLEYKGGVNYFKNLFIAIDRMNSGKEKVFLFVPDNLPEEYVSMFSPYCEIIRTAAIRRKSPLWWIDKLSEKAFNYNPIIEQLLRKYKIDVISHSNHVARSPNVRSINWVPDFQYLHYPNLWTPEQLSATKALHDRVTMKSDVIVLSSNDAFRDFKTAYPQYAEKVKVVHFVSQPAKKLLEIKLDQVQAAIRKYVSNIPYFYLPNQFWVHKNHMVALEACKLLRDEGFKFCLLTSGFMVDYRSKNQHVDTLRDFVQQNQLEDYVKFLGLIPYGDVFNLIIGAEALINPSHFEGWSSTVEEAKAVGTMTLLSDIPVHREQNPAKSAYFKPDSPSELAQLMKECLQNSQTKEFPIERLQVELDRKTADFGSNFLQIVNDLVVK